MTVRFAVGMQTVIASTIDCSSGDTDGCDRTPRSRWLYFGAGIVF